MVVLKRINGRSIFLAEETFSQDPLPNAGVVFLPETDDTIASLTLTNDLVETGFFACWGGGAPDLDYLEEALKIARDLAGPDGRRIVQIFHTGHPERLATLTARDRRVLAADLELWDPVVREVAGSHQLSLNACNASASDIGLAFDGTHQQRKVNGRAFDFRDVKLPIVGDLPLGAFIGKVALGSDDMRANGFATIGGVTGKPIFDQNGQPIGFGVDEDVRQVLHGADRNGLTPVACTACFDPADALNPARNFFMPNADQVLFSTFRTTLGHRVLLTPKPSPKADGTMVRPRFSYIQRRTSKLVSNVPVYEDASLILEGDFEVEFATMNTDGLAVATGIASSDVGLVIADSPHEFLALPDVLDGAGIAGDLTLRLRRGPGFIDPDSEPMTLRDTADQMVHATLMLDTEAGPVISEARNVRKLAHDGSVIRPDPFRLERKAAMAAAPTRPFFNVDPNVVPVFPRQENGQHLAREKSRVDGFGEPPQPLLDPRRGARGRKLASESGTPISDRFATERRAILFPSQRASGLNSRRETPLGFELIEDAQGNVVQIILAQTGADSDVSARLSVLPPRVGDQTLDPRVVNALVRNQLFMVVNRSGPLPGIGNEDFRLEGTLELSGWGFKTDLWNGWDIPLGENAPTIPLVIIKGYEGRSVRELMTDSIQWSGREFLATRRDGLTDVEYAKRVFDEAVAYAEHPKVIDLPTDLDTLGEPDEEKAAAFERFLQIIDDRNWNGVLILDLPMVPQVLPDEVKGIIGGIDVDRLRAHSLGIPVRRIAGTDRRSRPFATINYTSSDPVAYDTTKDPGEIPGPRNAVNGSDGSQEDVIFGMTVTLLRVGFDNGKLQSFNCSIDLSLGSFFHQVFESAEIVKVEGQFTRRLVNGETIETYDFGTETDFELKEDLFADMPLIKSAMIDSISYGSTVTKIGDDELVESRFDISGDIKFKPLSSDSINLDFFDIDKATFKNLGLDMRFIIPELGSVGWPRFRFSPGALLFNFADKTKKADNGFWNSLPLKFSGFGWLGDAVTLPGLGYFSLGQSSGPGANAPFFLKFDLDLGSLGSLASALGDFKMELALVFGFDATDTPHWDLGLRFAGAGGEDLNIGLQGFLELKCERYELRTLTHTSNDDEETTFYGFKGVDAKLIVFGKEFPPDGTAGIYIFVNPDEIATPAGVGWLMTFVDEASGSGAIDLETLALGQRVRPVKELGPGIVTTREVIEKFKELAVGVEDEMGEITIPDDIAYAPELGWTIGFRSVFYDLVHIGFATVDPELAGILLDVKLRKGSEDSLFSVDVLYRKLSDELGVYAIEIVLPPSMRNFQFGVVGITIPAIGIEIFTDGNWGIDIGYPSNKDFSRSFALNILPFVGAGGFYYRRVSGPAANLVPSFAKPENGSDNLPYNPVTEAGIGFRVGLGITLAQGILNAGLSVTIYGYLEGGFARLDNPNNVPTRANANYFTLWGAVGVMGEIYGYVDFGIIKAGVFVQLYVEVGFRLETDRATELYLEVGVRVRVRVVVASFKVFGKRIEIAVSFSFNHTVRFSRFIGNDRNRDAYLDRNGVPRSRLAIPATDNARTSIPWSTLLRPMDWTGSANAIGLSVTLQPDLTLAPNAEDPAVQEVHAVYTMAAKLVGDADPDGAERLVQGLTAWAVSKGVGIEPEKLMDTLIGLGELENVMDTLSVLGQSGPGYADITTFMKTNFDAVTIPTEVDNGSTDPNGSEPAGVLLPLPDAIQIDRSGVGTIGLSDFKFVDNTYRLQLEQAVERFVHVQRPGGDTLSELTGAKQSMAATLTEEWVEMIMRGGLARLIDNYTDGQGVPVEELLISGQDLLASLVEAKAAAVLQQEIDEDRVPLRSSAAEIAASTGRFFAYGTRVPHPADGTIPIWAEDPPAGRNGASDPQVRYFHSMTRLGGMQFPVGNAAGLSVPMGTYDWLKVGDGVETGAIDTTAMNALVMAGDALEIDGALALGTFFRERARMVSLGALGATTALTDVDDERLWRMSPEARVAFSELQAAEPKFRIAKPNPGAQQLFETAPHTAAFRPAIAIEVALRPVAGDSVIPDVFEIRAIAEPMRRMLDPFAPFRDGVEVNPPDLASVRVYKMNSDGDFVPVQDDHGLASLIQSNLSSSVEPAADILTTVPRDEDIVPVASRDEPVAFVRLLRQAAIVNTGGYHLTYPGATEDLKELFSDSGSADPLGATATIRVVIELAPNAYDYANALISDVTLGTGTEQPNATVLALEVDAQLDPLHDPGVIPIRVERMPASTPTLAVEIERRFSNLALEVVVRDPNNSNEVGTKQFLDQSIATGPDFRSEDPESEGMAEGALEYRLSVPAASIAFDARGFEDMYSIIGHIVEISGAWRDIYGNNWPKPLNTLTVPVVYSDRLFGLTGLPYLQVSYWPSALNTIHLGLESQFTALAALDIREQNDGFVPAAWLQATIRQIRQDHRLLRRAISQIMDARVIITAECPLGKTDPLDKPKILKHLKKVADTLIEIIGTLETGLPEGATKRGKLRAEILAKAKANMAFEKIPMVFAEPSTKIFDEFIVSVVVQREDPKDHPNLYDQASLSLLTSEGDDTAPLEDVWRSQETVFPALAGETAEEMPPNKVGFGGDHPGLLEAISRAADNYHVATGHGAVAGVTERTIWVIQKSFLDTLTKKAPDAFDTVIYGYPPLQNGAYSASIEIPRRGDVPATQRVTDVDADVFGQAALNRIEELLSPKVTVPLFEKVAGIPAKRAELVKAIGGLLEAKEKLADELGDTLTLVYADEAEQVGEDRTERLYNQAKDTMKRDLRSFYRVTTFLAYFDKTEHPAPNNVRLAHGAVPNVQNGIALKAYGIPLEVKAPVSNDLFVSCEIDPETNTPTFSLPEHLTLSHVQQWERPDLADDDSFRPTAWLRLHTPEGPRDPESPPWNEIALPTEGVIPRIARTLPKTPGLENERFDPFQPSDGLLTVRDARRWESVRDIRWEAGATDRLTVTTDFEPPKARMVAATEEPGLARRMVTFALATEGEMSNVAKHADLEAYVWVAEQSQALATNPLSAAAVTSSTSSMEDSVTLWEKDGSDGLVTFVVESLSMANDGEEGRAILYGPGDDDNDITFTAAGEVPTLVLANEGRRKRVFKNLGLDILTHGSATTKIVHTRNAIIEGRPLEPRFVYTLPVVQSGEPVVPAIDRLETVAAGEIAFEGDSVRPGDVEQVVIKFFEDLLEPLSGAPSTKTDIILEYESGLFSDAEEGGPIIAVFADLEGVPTDRIPSIVSAIETWLSTKPAYENGKPLGQLVIDARVFLSEEDGGEQDRRILWLRRCAIGFKS